MSKKILISLILISLIILSFLFFKNFKKPEKIEVLAKPAGCWGTEGACNPNCQYDTRTPMTCYVSKCVNIEFEPLCGGDSTAYTFSGTCSSDGTGSCFIRGDPTGCYTSCAGGADCTHCGPNVVYSCSRVLPLPIICASCGCTYYENASPYCDTGSFHCINIPDQASCEACLVVYETGTYHACLWLVSTWQVVGGLTTAYTAGTQCTWYTEPTVSTLDATDITGTSATLRGEITATGNLTVTERGFDWRGEDEATWTSWTETGTFGTGIFEHNITGLTPYKTYYFRAKAKNSMGWGYGEEKSFLTLDTIPPSVQVTGAPAIWQNTDACAGITCTDGETGCDSTSFKFKVIPYTATPPTCSDYNYETDYSFPTPNGCLANEQKISSHSWVCGAAKDNSGNIGFSTPVEFRVDKDKPVSQVVSPEAGSWHKDDFSVTLRYSDSGDSGLTGCYWKVISGGDTTLDWTSAGVCSGDGPVDILKTLTVGDPISCPTCLCRHEGENACTVYVYAVDTATNTGDIGFRSFSISWTAPITTIECNNSGVWGTCLDTYLNSVEVRLVCTPGVSDCLGTYYCVDQTNTCDPDPCSP